MREIRLLLLITNVFEFFRDFACYTNKYKKNWKPWLWLFYWGENGLLNIEMVHFPQCIYLHFCHVYPQTKMASEIV